MACGIFATLIMGMFLRQIANLFPSDFNSTLIHLSGIATGLTGIGIGVGVACQLQEAPLVVLCAGIAGMLGAMPPVRQRFCALFWLPLQLLNFLVSLSKNLVLIYFCVLFGYFYAENL